MRKIFWLLLLAGLIACPLYMLYCAHYSGVHLRDIEWNHPAEFQLDPSMNPLSVVAKAKYPEPMSMRRATSNFIMELYKDDQMFLKQRFTISDERSEKSNKKVNIAFGNGGLATKSSSVALRTFVVSQTGKYRMWVASGSNSTNPLHITDLTLSIRRNVMLPQKHVWISGGVCILIGIVGLMAIVIFKKK